ncbi:hypothetical protein M9194_00640 [Vibrio sp. S4M6]|uniref:cupredoxin domain-containing protein n=1 Tax=Vibrio sinus TaxID=2946865 RepID=UPI002029CC0D|nr:plastocyanin/azurin family copper-binding protein [Vibrio sinus]MCL9779938.1 hypothetical protein [Vibrio sinus]
MKTIFYFVLLFFSFGAIASTDVMEGDDAKSSYEASKDSVVALIQKRKTFYLQEPGNPKLKRKPKELTVKAGEVIYILNSEKKITHNIYDTTDESWVLTAQEPGDVAAVKFDDPGEHDLKCAIHPKMKIKVIVE